MTTEPTPIGIAIVIHQNKVLVGYREGDVPLTGMAEFPGGKCLPNESSEQCAIRECLEETGLQVVTKTLLHEAEHHYPHGLLQLSFWQCEPEDSGYVHQNQNNFHWVERSQLTKYDFPEANQQVIQVLGFLYLFD